MRQAFKSRHTAGFTLIEMMVSLALFTIVATITVGALLSLIGGNQRLVKQQTLTSSAIFSLDNMTREIRTGNYYYCGDSAASRGSTQVNDCSGGSSSMSFVESSTRNSGGRVSYYFSSNSLWRRIGNGGTAEKLLPDDVSINTSASRFFVTGTPTLTASNNVQQPVVTVIMVLSSTDDTEPITLQTTITQRSLDI